MTNELKEKLEKIGKYLDSTPTLVLAACYDSVGMVSYKRGDIFKEYPPTVQEFLITFYNRLNPYFHTYEDGKFTTIETSRIQTYFSKFRSFPDLYRLAKHHYKELTFPEFVKIIVQLDNKKSGELIWYFCPTIKKRCLCTNKSIDKYYGGRYSLSTTYTNLRNEDELGLSEEELNSLL